MNQFYKKSNELINISNVGPPRIVYEELEEVEEEFEEKIDELEDDLQMIRDIVDDAVKNTPEVPAQPVIWREVELREVEEVDADRMEESVTDDDDYESPLNHLIISKEQEEIKNYVVKNGNNMTMDLFGQEGPEKENEYAFDQI